LIEIILEQALNYNVPMGQAADAEKIKAILWSAVDELNLQLRRDQRLAKNPDERLTGEGGRLDSLGLINLLVLTEQRIEAEFGCPIMLADDQAMAAESSPFATLGTLAEHIRKLLQQKLS
jgi:acyl carrier protein